MWVHIIIFVIIFGCAAAWKAGWIHLEGLEKKGRRCFFLAASAGNLLGMLLTLTSGGGRLYDQDFPMIRQEDGDYEQKVLVSVDGEKETPLYIQVPGKEGQEEEEEARELTEEEEREIALREAVIRYNQLKNDPDYYYLPPEWEGKALQWRQPEDPSGSMIAGLGLLAAAALLLKSLKEKQDAAAKRNEQLLMDYPGLIMKFTLLVQAGMTVRRAFGKIAADYGRKREGAPRFAYEEIAAACHEMESGVSELEAYRRFGERCGQIKYKTFATLLIQNLQKGSRRMSDMLEQESLEAWDERKRKARVLGEAAATKLLLPMVMMLAVVMAIVMIPAFLSL